VLLAHHILLDKVSRTKYLAIKGGGGFVEKYLKEANFCPNTCGDYVYLVRKHKV